CPERQMRIFIVPEPAGRSLARSFSERPMIPELGMATSSAGRKGTPTALEATTSKCAAYVAGAVCLILKAKRPFLSALTERTGVVPEYSVMGAPRIAGAIRPLNV